jgi:hypothetical protein
MRKHRTAEADITAQRILQQVEALSEAQQEHLQDVVQLLLTAYKTKDTPDASSGVLLLRSPITEEIAFITINANEFDAAEIISFAHEAHQQYLVSDAPESDRFN